VKDSGVVRIFLAIRKT